MIVNNGGGMLDKLLDGILDFMFMIMIIALSVLGTLAVGL